MTAATGPAVPGPDSGAPAWQRLSARVVWVDLAVVALASIPGALGLWFAGSEADAGVVWPLLTVAVVGLISGIGDLVRWGFTRYRVTATDVELRSGVLLRKHRTVPRERLRSVDTAAKLRHRIAGLRVVTVGAGQQSGAGESALVLDALSRADATVLQAELLGTHRSPEPSPHPEPDAAAEETGGADAPGVPGAPVKNGAHGAPGEDVAVLATFRPWWVVYNMVNIWAFLMAAGLLWGGFWLASLVDLDVVGYLAGVADWEAMGWVGVTAVALVATGALGAFGLGVHFLVAYWGFELARVRSGERVSLRTRRGLLSTREVNRDEARIRGVSIGEPLLWRWMGMADTNVITTGLNVWDMEEPTAILPRGPRGAARAAAREVLGELDPLATDLTRHPQAALRRRLAWATVIAAVPALLVALPVLTGNAPLWLLWAALAVWPLAAAGASVSWRSLGHAIDGRYLIVRSGLLSRTTSALRRDAVSTIAVRQSVLQRRIGLATVSAMTAAGWSAYRAIDVDAEAAVRVADGAAPHVLAGFLDRTEAPVRGE